MIIYAASRENLLLSCAEKLKKKRAADVCSVLGTFILRFLGCFEIGTCKIQMFNYIDGLCTCADRIKSCLFVLFEDTGNNASRKERIIEFVFFLVFNQNICFCYSIESDQYGGSFQNP